MSEEKRKIIGKTILEISKQRGYDSANAIYKTTILPRTYLSNEHENVKFIYIFNYHTQINYYGVKTTSEKATVEIDEEVKDLFDSKLRETRKEIDEER